MLDKIRAYITLLRIFIFPWLAVNTLLGNRLAGFDIHAWGLALLITTLVAFAGHMINAFRDYELGFDGVNGSVPKPYTSACSIIPSGIISVRVAKVSTLVFLLASLLMIVFFAPLRVDTVSLYILGVFCALTYTDLGKKHSMGELYLFLGHGFGTSTFAYSLVRPITIEALATGTLLGLLAGVIYTVDQWVDAETDFARRVKNYAYLITKANMRLSTFFYFAVTAVVTIHLAFVLMGILRASTLKALLLMPLFQFSGALLDYQFEKGVWVALTAIWLYPILMAL